MFIPVTKKELSDLGWEKLDIILVTGDAYIDSPFIGVSIIGKVLIDTGYRVGIIAQPDVSSSADIMRLGEPELFWGVTSGSIDSMVANYTASMKKRKSDDLTPGGRNEKRPDRAVIAYTNLIKKHFKNTKPVVLGGIEASLRRIPHYDQRDNKIRRSVLFDAKADYLVYGMGERTIIELADALKNKSDISDIKGLVYISKDPAISENDIILPSFDEVKTDKELFTEMFKTFYDNTDPVTARRLLQKHDTRYLVLNKPQNSFSQAEIDAIYDLDYEYDAHPAEKSKGDIRALETIRFSITSHRGCYGECNFCSITIHQGRVIESRSERSIIREAKKLTKLPGFKGYILDVGGPSANMYGSICKRMNKKGVCTDKDCLFPKQCKTLEVNHKKQIDLLKKIAKINGIKKVFVASGLRHDMVINDQNYGTRYLEELIKNHISGQLKIAPEHTEDNVLRLMRKTGINDLIDFKGYFEKLNKKPDKKQFLTYYLIAAHPGCGMSEMKELRKFAVSKLHLLPEQVQIFTPTPSTYSTLMYYTGKDPFTGEKIFVEMDIRKKEKQKAVIAKKK
ncbi:YgiQ family radical SAM protein [candidate division KSB1 bacterium]